MVCEASSLNQKQRVVDVLKCYCGQARNIGGVGEGLVEGGEALAQGFLRGVTGLVQRPLQGAAQAGVGGAPLVTRACCLLVSRFL